MIPINYKFNSLFMAQKIYENVKGNHLKRNAFDLAHDKKLTCNMGNLIPILCEEVIPGDSFKNKTELMLRLAPMIAPIYHRVDVYTHFFFVPNRILWKGWEEFITNQDSGLTPPNYVITPDNKHLFHESSLADYLGVPINNIGVNSNPLYINSLPFMAYNKIWEDYYRDENLQSEDYSYPVPEDGVVTYGYEDIMTLKKRAWEKDYFTSALPFAQKGQPVTFPLAGDAPVQLVHNSSSTQRLLLPNSSDPSVDNIAKTLGNPGTMQTAIGHHNVLLDPNGTLKVNFDQITSITVNQFREAIQLQSFLELNARAGTRYTEYLLARFGVRSKDARLQRPEYLGGGVQNVVISEVLQTGATQADSPQGNMSGHGISVGGTNEFKAYFEEHGFVIGIMSILPRTCYQQGLPRKFFRNDLFDYYTPEFAHIGEQPVLNKELFLSPVAATDKDYPNNETFGYQSRYNEYKQIAPSVHGQFRSSLSFWTLSRIFPNLPQLNEDFIKSQPRNDIFAVQDEDIDHILVQVYNDLKALRPMPYFGTPKSLF